MYECWSILGVTIPSYCRCCTPTFAIIRSKVIPKCFVPKLPTNFFPTSNCYFFFHSNNIAQLAIMFHSLSQSQISTILIFRHSQILHVFADVGKNAPIFSGFLFSLSLHNMRLFPYRGTDIKNHSLSNETASTDSRKNHDTTHTHFHSY